MLEDAFSPWHQLADERHEAAEKIANIIQNSTLNAAQVPEMVEAFKGLRTVLQWDTTAMPDPAWVTQTAEAVAAGKHPFIPDPQKAMAVLREAREVQVEKIQPALDLLYRVQGIFQKLDAAFPAEDL